MTTYLLDVNVLLSLSDPMHVHHEAAHRWREGHIFWPDAVSLRSILQPSVLLTHNQVTDVYLLGLSIAQGGKLATFDQRIPVVVVPGGEEALEIMSV